MGQTDKMTIDDLIYVLGRLADKAEHYLSAEGIRCAVRVIDDEREALTLGMQKPLKFRFTRTEGSKLDPEMIRVNIEGWHQIETMNAGNWFIEESMRKLKEHCIECAKIQGLPCEFIEDISS